MPPDLQELAAAWYKLARAVAIADRGSLEVEEKIALHYGVSVLMIKPEDAKAGKQQADDLDLGQALTFVSGLDETLRRAVLVGMILISKADGLLHARETDFITATCAIWNINDTELSQISTSAHAISDLLQSRELES